MIKNNFIYGLKIDGKLIVHGDTIKITKVDGISKMSHLFRIGVIDEVIIRFLNHDKYNTLIGKIFLKKNNSIISIGERFEQSQEEYDYNPKSYRRFPCKPIEITTNFADELESSNGKLYFSK